MTSVVRLEDVAFRYRKPRTEVFHGLDLAFGIRRDIGLNGANPMGEQSRLTTVLVSSSRKYSPWPWMNTG